MKIKDGFILREVAGSFIVVAVGSAVKDFNGIININETGAFLWKLLEKGAEREEIISKMMETYDVDEETARRDADAFINKLREAKLVL